VLIAHAVPNPSGVENISICNELGWKTQNVISLISFREAYFIPEEQEFSYEAGNERTGTREGRRHRDRGKFPVFITVNKTCVL
jgi:hypothetical protein